MLINLNPVVDLRSDKKYFINPFTPDFIKWTLSFLNLDISIVTNRVSVTNQKQNYKIINSADPGETAH